MKLIEFCKNKFPKRFLSCFTEFNLTICTQNREIKLCEIYFQQYFLLNIVIILKSPSITTITTTTTTTSRLVAKVSAASSYQQLVL